MNISLQPYFDILNSFFDHIYVITLQRAADRQRHIQHELAGLNYQLFFGHDKQQFTIEDIKQQGIYNEALAKKHHRYNKPMHAGQIGCAWSHTEVYKDMVQNNYQQVLILEDDIVLDKNQLPLISDILPQLPADWELLYFVFAQQEKAPPLQIFTKAYYHVLRLISATRLTAKTIHNYYPKKINQHIYTAGYHDCTHAYAITQPAAQKLLALQQPISFIADNLLAYACTNEVVKGYIILPKIIHQQYQVNINTLSYLNE